MAVYTSEQSQQSHTAREVSILLDPNLLRAARRIYRTYCAINTKMSKRPFGVAIDKETHRGQLLFTTKPILLPRECFVPVKQIESELY